MWTRMELLRLLTLPSQICSIISSRAYDTVLMKKEIFQKRAFLSGQRKRKSIDTGLSCTGIKADTSALQTYILLNKFPSCQTSDPCLQLFKMKRLCEIVIGTEIKPFNLVLDLSSGREDQNGSGSIGSRNWRRISRPSTPGRFRSRRMRS